MKERVMAKFVSNKISFVNLRTFSQSTTCEYSVDNPGSNH